jgi:hypothetical protein
MYTVSNRVPLLLQRGAFAFTSLLGARFLPGKGDEWPTSGWEDVWDGLRSEIADVIGPFSHVAVYRRRQAERSGLTMTVVDKKRAVAVVKVREESETLALEQVALRAVRDAAPHDVTLHWSAQTSVFSRPHRPDVNPPDSLFDDVSHALEPVLEAQRGLRPAHNDLTLWNLRLDHRGQRWLFDWEDVGLAPPQADRVYFASCLHALRETPMPAGLPADAVQYWRSALETRRDTTVSDQELTSRLLQAVCRYQTDL